MATVSDKTANPQQQSEQTIQRQMKPEKCPLGKTQRRRLWGNLRKYCDELFAVGFPQTHRFEPPQHAIDMFAELGLRHPRNPRALRKFYNNFIPRCGHLAENGVGDKKRKWKPKPGYNGSPPPAVSGHGHGRGHARSNNGYSKMQVPPTQAQTQTLMPSMKTPQVGAAPTPAMLKQQQQRNDQISRWLAANCFEVSTPSALHGVPINRSSMRRDGLNIVSMDYSNKHPDPTQTLHRNEPMIVFGAQNAAQQFGAGTGQHAQQAPATPADPAFVREMASKRMAFVPVPPCMVGSTLAETPQLSQAGINMLSVNMRVQHPATLCQRRFVANDTLVCLFDDSFVDKHEKLTAVFEEIQRVKRQLNINTRN